MSARQQFIPGGGGGASSARPLSRSTARTNTPALRPSQDTPGGSHRVLNIDNFQRKGSASQKLLSLPFDSTKDKSHSTLARRINTSAANLHAPRPVLPPQSLSPVLINNDEEAMTKKAHTSRSFFAGDLFPSAQLVQSEPSSTRPVAKRSRAEYDDEQEGDISYEFGYPNSKRYKTDNVRSLPL